MDIREDHPLIVMKIIQRCIPDRDVWVFGSRAKRSAKRYSDLDLLVMGKDPLSLKTCAALADAFSDSDLPYKVDVVDWATTSPSFRAIIEADMVPLQVRSH